MEIVALLTYLATKQNVSASTQNQALSALLFFYQSWSENLAVSTALSTRL
jgi:hypothetical protein